jgi:hypothetical protein
MMMMKKNKMKWNLQGAREQDLTERSSKKMRRKKKK